MRAKLNLISLVPLNKTIDILFFVKSWQEDITKMPLPNHLQQQQFNKTDSNLLREEEDTAELQQQVLRRANPLVRRSSLMNDELMKRQDSTKRLPREDSMKRLPGDEENHSFKKLPFGDETSGIHERQMSTKRLPRRNSILDESGTIVDTSFKRLPSVANGRTSGLFDEPGSIQRQSSVNNRSDDAPLLHRRMSIKEMANMSGGDLLNRQSTMTRRNSIASEDSRPSLARRGSIVGGLMKALRLDETDEEKRRRIVKSWDDFKELYRVRHFHSSVHTL